MRDHLLLRGLDPSLYRVWLSDTCATFPLWGFDGRLRGFQQYRPSAPKKSERPSEGRYFTWSSAPSVWGLDTLPSHGVVFVCESIFKAVAAHRAGFNAISANGSSLAPSLQGQMMLMTQYRFICVGDDDAAGLKFSKTFGKGATAPDLDELPLCLVQKLLTEACYG
jgi:hypothetical protein